MDVCFESLSCCWMNPWPTWYIPRFCMLIQNLVVAVGSVLVSICTSHSPWIQQNSPRTSHFLYHVWHLMSHTEEPSFHLFNGIKKSWMMNGRFQILKVFSGPLVVFHGPGKAFFFLFWRQSYGCFAASWPVNPVSQSLLFTVETETCLLLSCGPVSHLSL